MTNGWKVSYLNTAGDKPQKEVVVLAVKESESVEDMFGKYVSTAHGGIEEFIEGIKFEKIGRFFNVVEESN